jgi:hypothetical protein
MTKLLVFAGLAASLLVPAGGVAVVVVGATSAGARRSPDELRSATEFDKDQIVAIRNELAELDRRATPGSSAQILEARRIAARRGRGQSASRPNRNGKGSHWRRAPSPQ